MKILLKALGIVVLAGIGTGAVLYLDAHCPKKQKAEQERINAMIAKYIENNPQFILEQIAKNENFANTVKNFSIVSDEDLNAKINTFFDNNPNLIENAVNRLAENLKTTSASDDQESEETSGEDNPNKIYLDHWDEIKNSEAAPSVGPDDAPVVVAEFFDFACGHCKSLAPVMGQLIKNNPDVKFVFNPLYFISTHSNYAAKAAMVAAEKGKFIEVYDGIMTLPDMNEETINQILADEGIDVDEAKGLMEEKKIRRGSQDIDALSQVLGINGVPMVLINGEAFYGRSLQDLQNKINSYK